jgi:hypothetical protein
MSVRVKIMRRDGAALFWYVYMTMRTALASLLYIYIHLLSLARHLILIEVMNSACALVLLQPSAPSNKQQRGSVCVSSKAACCALSFDQAGKINNNTCSVYITLSGT